MALSIANSNPLECIKLNPFSAAMSEQYPAVSRGDLIYAALASLPRLILATLVLIPTSQSDRGHSNMCSKCTSNVGGAQ